VQLIFISFICFVFQEEGLGADEHPVACPGIQKLNNNKIMNMYKTLYQKSHIQRSKENKVHFRAHSFF
jgi:hypothetical protein